MSIAVLGAGSWGTALAVLLADQGHETLLWARRGDLAEKLEKTRENTEYLPGVTLPKNLEVSSDPKALKNIDHYILAFPTQHSTAMLDELKDYLNPEGAFLQTAKGIDLKSGLFLSDLFSFPRASYAVLSGPGYAKAVAQKEPSAITIAAKNLDVAKEWQTLLQAPYFRPYISADVRGVEVGGAYKNVLALAAGIVMGLGFGMNTQAALLTRGFAEMRRLCIASGGQAETLVGLCGMGDLILTCLSLTSRNTSFGYALAKGEKAADILAGRHQVTEGVSTLKALQPMIAKLDLPIAKALSNVIDQGQDPKEEMQRLMARPLTCDIM